MTIAGFELTDQLGRGGFATVWRAIQLSVGREVAIKLLNDPDPSPDLIRRFTRESRAVGALSWHPHIAAVIDAGTTDEGQAYIVFELLTGGSLEDAIASGPMRWAEAVSAIIQVSDAVEAAHRADVLHRDIKPANVMRDRFGTAKLADFGIASMQDGAKTATGQLAMTVAHAAPELFETGTATPSTDVYALGSTLHNLIAGQAPFGSPTGEGLLTSIARIANEQPPRLSPQIAPPVIADVVDRALAKSPTARIGTAAELGRALQTAQAQLSEPITSMPIVDEDAVSNASATQIVNQPPQTHPSDVTSVAEPEWFPLAEPEWFE